MTNVIKLREVHRARADGNTLCRSGFHKWHVATEGRFDVKQGKLLTAEHCLRCGKTRVRRT